MQTSTRRERASAGRREKQATAGQPPEAQTDQARSWTSQTDEEREAPDGQGTRDEAARPRISSRNLGRILAPVGQGRSRKLLVHHLDAAVRVTRATASTTVAQSAYAPESGFAHLAREGSIKCCETTHQGPGGQVRFTRLPHRGSGKFRGDDGPRFTLGSTLTRTACDSRKGSTPTRVNCTAVLPGTHRSGTAQSGLCLPLHAPCTGRSVADGVSRWQPERAGLSRPRLAAHCAPWPDSS